MRQPDMWNAIGPMDRVRPISSYVFMKRQNASMSKPRRLRQEARKQRWTSCSTTTSPDTDSRVNDQVEKISATYRTDSRCTARGTEKTARGPTTAVGKPTRPPTQPRRRILHRTRHSSAVNDHSGVIELNHRAGVASRSTFIHLNGPADPSLVFQKNSRLSGDSPISVVGLLAYDSTGTSSGVSSSTCGGAIICRRSVRTSTRPRTPLTTAPKIGIPRLRSNSFTW